jgi:hypothetical protein
MIPEANMKVVIPNMNILGRDEVKPGFLLEAIYYKHASPFLRRHNPQEDVGRGNIDYDINTREAVIAYRVQWFRNWTSNGESLVPHHIPFQ